jgi:signal transduction histidine kinase/DNA-binding response OmpR family regulator
MGKTALLEQALRDLGAEGALTGVGRHLKGHGGSDLAPLITALEAAAASGLEQLFEPDAGLTTLATALGPAAVAFNELGAGLLHGMAARAPAVPMPAEAAEERLVQAVLAVLRWLEGFNRAVILLLDDWGRASERSVRLYERILAEPGLDNLRLLATERLDEPSPLGAAHTDSWSLELLGLAPAAMAEVIDDTLGASAGAAGAEVLAFLQAECAPPLDLIQSTLLLEQAGALTFDGANWIFDPSRAASALGDSLSSTIAGRLQRISPDGARLARVLSVLGEPADRVASFELCGFDAARGEAAVAQILASGLVWLVGDTIAVSHDRIRETILASLNPDARQQIAADIAEHLRQRSTASIGVMSAMLALRLDAGLGEIDAASWAPLFARGARHARAVGDQENAALFAEAALRLADGGGTHTSEILTEATLAAVRCGDGVQAKARAVRLVELAATARERAEADEVGVFVARMAGDMDAALQIGLEATRRAGIQVPPRPTMLTVAREVVRLRLADTGRAARAGPLSDEELTLIAPRLRVLMATGSLLHERNIRQAIIHGARSAKGRLGSGTALGASVSAFVCAMTGAYERAGRWATISDARQSLAQPNRAAAMITSTYFGHWFSRPRAELALRIDHIEALAYAEGDLSNAAYANRNRVLDALFLTRSLPETAALADTALLIAARLKDSSTRPIIAAVRQIAENLTDPGAPRWRLEGRHFDEVAPAPVTSGSANELNNVRRPLAMLEAFLAVLCGRYDETVAIHERLNWTFKANMHNPQMAIWAFATGLAFYRAGLEPPRGQARILRRLARLNPRDNSHRQLLLEAERQRVRRRPDAALRLYERASAASQASDCWLEQGLVARAAAEGTGMLGASAAALGFQSQADAAWRKMGATSLLRGSAGFDSDLGALHAQFTQLSADYEKRQLELADARDTAERANRAKSRLLAAVGHELRTPLQGVAGLLELAETSPQALEVDVLRGAIAQLTSVVGDLTDLGALDGGALSLSPGPFDPHALVAGVAAVHRPSLAGTSRDIRLSPPTVEPLLVGDQGRVRQIVSNLIGNAVKHGAGDVRVVLATARRSDGIVDLTIDVADDGPGLTPHDVLRLFEPFERGQGAEKREGLGLGLSVARRLAHAMGGDLTVQSIPGAGTVFRLVLQLPVGNLEPAPPLAAHAGLRVLLAEDAPLSRRVIAALLRAEGCLVDEAEDGDAALAGAMRLDFDLMILDMRMPGRDGLAVAQAVRDGAGRNAATPTAIFTASHTEDVESRAREIGIEVVLQKPIGGAELRRLLAGVTSGRWTAVGPGPPYEASSSMRLRELREALGDAEADLLLVQVRPNMQDAMARLRLAMDGRDFHLAVQDAHRLSGLSSHFGLTALSRAADDLEKCLEGAAAGDAPVGAQAQLMAVESALGSIDWIRFSERVGDL